MKLSQNQLSELTGKDRKTIKKLLDGLPFTIGAHRARLYESRSAFEAIYYGAAGDADRKITAYDAALNLNIKRAEEIDLDMQIKRKERIPLSVIASVDDEVFQSIAATLKAHKDKKLTGRVINDIFDLLRSIPSQRNW